MYIYTHIYNFFFCLGLGLELGIGRRAKFPLRSQPLELSSFFEMKEDIALKKGNKSLPQVVLELIIPSAEITNIRRQVWLSE